MNGCATQRQALIVAGVGALVMGGGGVLTQVPCHSDPGSDGDCNQPINPNLLLGILALSVGGVVVVSSLSSVVYLGATADDRRVAEAASARDDPEEQTAIERKRRRGDAKLLLKRAIVSADEGDCTTVWMINSQVLALDADFHKTVFLADMGVTRCLAQAVSSPLVDPAPGAPAPPPVPPVQP